MKQCECCGAEGTPTRDLKKCGAFHAHYDPMPVLACYYCRASGLAVALPDGLDLDNPAPRFWAWIKKHTPNASEDWGI